MGYSLVTLKQLVNDCGLSISSSKKVRIGLNKLLQKKLIKIYNNYDEESEVDIYQCSNNHQLIIKSFEMIAENDSFIMIKNEEIEKFIRLNIGLKKSKIFRQFLYIVGLINQGNKYRKICFPSITDIAKKTNISDRSVKNYNKILIDKGFLTYNTLIIEEEKIKNIYARPEDFQDIQDAIAQSIKKHSKYISTIITEEDLQRHADQVVNSLDNSKKNNKVAPQIDPTDIVQFTDDEYELFVKYNVEINGNSTKILAEFKQKYKDSMEIAIINALSGKRVKNPTGFLISTLKSETFFRFIRKKQEERKKIEESLERDMKESAYLFEE